VAARLADFEAVIAMRERTPFPRHSSSACEAQAPRDDRHAQRIHRRRAASSARSWSAAPRGFLPDGGAHVGLILALFRRIPPKTRDREGRWQISCGLGLTARPRRRRPGRLGSRVAKIGRAFEMGLIAWSQTSRPPGLRDRRDARHQGRAAGALRRREHSSGLGDRRCSSSARASSPR